MGDLTDKSDLIPAEQSQQFESWQMPVLESPGRVVNVAGKTSRRDSGTAAGRPEPLTASKIEAIRQQAYQEGLSLGKQDGLRQTQAEVDEKMAQLDRIMGQLMHPLAEQDAELEQALVNLTQAVAQAVVKSCVQFDGAALLQIIKQALEQLPDGSEHIRVYVHPQDAEQIKNSSGQVSDEWQIIPDASLVSGGCIVKTDYSYVDFTLEKQFQLTVDEMVKRNMSGALGSQGGIPPNGAVE